MLWEGMKHIGPPLPIAKGVVEQELSYDAWVKTQIHYWNQQLYQYRPDPGYQPIYYRHGK